MQGWKAYDRPCSQEDEKYLDGICRRFPNNPEMYADCPRSFSTECVVLGTLLNPSVKNYFTSC